MRLASVAFVSLLLAAWPSARAAAQVELTVASALTRGPERAAVTIVEFVDFE